MTYKKYNYRPLVSVIVTTKNSENTIEDCLNSIKNQNYPSFELLIVDNKSVDSTLQLAKKYSRNVFIFGPERSSQRNFGSKKSHGDYLLFIDSDMKLSPNVIKACADIARENSNLGAVIIPEESFGQGFWAQCKKLERSFYVGVDWIEAARFYKKKSFEEAGGYDEKLVSGEDWDLSQRIKKYGKVLRINNFIYHNEGKLSLLRTIKKKYYYLQMIRPYLAKDKNKKYFMQQGSLVQRYCLYFSNPKKLFRSPLLGIGMLFMKTSEFSFGALGYILGRIKYR